MPGPWVPQGELPRHHHGFLTVYFCCCTYVVGLESLAFVFVTPLFEWTVLRRRPVFQGWDSLWLWYGVALPDGHPGQDGVTWRFGAVFSTALFNKCVFFKATWNLNFHSPSRVGSGKAEKPFCLEVWVVCGGDPFFRVCMSAQDRLLWNRKKRVKSYLRQCAGERSVC